MRKDYPRAARKLPPKRKRNSINVLTIKDACANIKAWLNKRKGKTTMLKNNKNKAEATTVKKVANKQGNKANGIIGLLLLVVVLSIAYSTYVVWFGTTGLVPKIMLAPQMIFAAAVLVWKFNK